MAVGVGHEDRGPAAAELPRGGHQRAVGSLRAVGRAVRGEPGDDLQEPVRVAAAVLIAELSSNVTMVVFGKPRARREL